MGWFTSTKTMNDKNTQKPTKLPPTPTWPCTVNIYMYKTIEARVITIAIPTTGKSCSLYRELLKPLWVIYQ